MAQNTLFFQERQLTNGGAFRKSILNIPKAWASINRKNALAVDSKGYLQTYICKVEVVSTDVLAYLYTVPENWVIKNAVRKWHAFRDQKRVEFGQDGYQSTYGRHIRPLMHSGHQTTNNNADYYELQALHQGGPLNGGDWDYTTVAQATGVKNVNATDSVAAEELADKYILCLTGNHVLETGHTTSIHDLYTHVSMSESYIASRRNQSIDDTAASGAVQEAESPLAEFMVNSAASKVQSTILREEQLQKPPYEQTSSATDVPTDATRKYYAGALITTSTYGRDSAIIRVPGGLLECWSQGQGATPLPFWNIEVLGVVRSEG